MDAKKAYADYKRLKKKLGVKVKTDSPGSLLMARAERRHEAGESKKFEAKEAKGLKRKEGKKHESKETKSHEKVESKTKEVKENKKRKGAKSHSKIAFTSSKAKKILSEKKPTLRGHAITSKQRKWLGWQAGGGKK